MEAGLLAAAALGSFHRLAAHIFGGGSSPPEAMQQSLKAATAALEECENALYDIDSALGDAEDSLLAMQHLTSPTHATRLSEVLIAGQELARFAVRPVGGAALPDLSFDPELYTPRALAVALLATSLTMVAAQLDSRASPGGIEISVHDRGSTAAVDLAPHEVAASELERIASELNDQLGGESTVSLDSSESRLRLAFQVVPPSA
jgi:hypothetical protein